MLGQFNNYTNGGSSSSAHPPPPGVGCKRTDSPTIFACFNPCGGVDVSLMPPSACGSGAACNPAPGTGGGYNYTDHIITYPFHTPGGYQARASEPDKPGQGVSQSQVSASGNSLVHRDLSNFKSLLFGQRLGIGRVGFVDTRKLQDIMVLMFLSGSHTNEIAHLEAVFEVWIKKSVDIIVIPTDNIHTHAQNQSSGADCHPNWVYNLRWPYVMDATLVCDAFNIRREDKAVLVVNHLGIILSRDGEDMARRGPPPPSSRPGPGFRDPVTLMSTQLWAQFLDRYAHNRMPVDKSSPAMTQDDGDSDDKSSLAMTQMATPRSHITTLRHTKKINSSEEEKKYKSTGSGGDAAPYVEGSPKKEERKQYRSFRYETTSGEADGDNLLTNILSFP